ncbi:flagellar biosynthetic protein FliR [Massilia endophytica]|uniref:flagellar biosynthetic protein FliR n=1 Tax=Massilia endophytica TaxID=2899220 RepID=UPI001E2AAEB2|nr:flagellar biosynthetic protein FliR [Massilia endophytica]UGQ47984.1 flagellar biosynthetic protein FliR [Massilia endophytica]
MLLEVAHPWIVAVLLCATRIGIVLQLTPLLSGFGVPVRIKVALVLAISAACVSRLAPPASAAPADLAGLALALVAELGNGALFAYGVSAAFGAVAFAGKVLDIQSGFGLGNVFDPVTRSQAPLLGAILGQLSIVVFFLSDAHHTLLRGLRFSLEQLPLGQALQIADPGLLVAQFGTIFSLGLVLAGPVAFLLFLLDIGLAVVSRTMPQMNVLMLGTPLKAGLSLGMLAALGPQLGPVLQRIFAALFNFWTALL